MQSLCLFLSLSLSIFFIYSLYLSRLHLLTLFFAHLLFFYASLLLFISLSLNHYFSSLTECLSIFSSRGGGQNVCKLGIFFLKSVTFEVVTLFFTHLLYLPLSFTHNLFTLSCKHCTSKSISLTLSIFFSLIFALTQPLRSLFLYLPPSL